MSREVRDELHIITFKASPLVFTPGLHKLPKNLKGRPHKGVLAKISIVVQRPAQYNVLLTICGSQYSQMRNTWGRRAIFPAYGAFEGKNQIYETEEQRKVHFKIAADSRYQVWCYLVSEAILVVLCGTS